MLYTNNHSVADLQVLEDYISGLDSSTMTTEQKNEVYEQYLHSAQIDYVYYQDNKLFLESVFGPSN